MNIAIYTRGQTAEERASQEANCRSVAEERGFNVVDVIHENVLVSGPARLIRSDTKYLSTEEVKQVVWGWSDCTLLALVQMLPDLCRARSNCLRRDFAEAAMNADNLDTAAKALSRLKLNFDYIEYGVATLADPASEPQA